MVNPYSGAEKGNFSANNRDESTPQLSDTANDDSSFETTTSQDSSTKNSGNNSNADYEISSHAEVFPDSASSGFLLVSKNGRIIKINQTAAEFFGETSQAITKRRLQKFLTTNSIAVFETFLKALYHENQLLQCELEVKNIGTQTRFLQISGKISVETNTCNLALTDITRLKKAEKALLERNELLAKIAQFSSDLSLLAFADNLEAFVSKRIKELTGCIGVIFSEYDSKNRMLIPRHLEFEHTLLQRAVSIFGNQIQKIHSPVDTKTYEKITKQTYGIVKTLHEATFGEIPKATSALVSKLIGADRFIGVAYMIEGELYGTSLLAMASKQPDPPLDLMQNISFLVAVSLRRKKAEMAQHQAKWRIESIIEGTNVGTWEWNIETGELIINDVWAKIIGYTTDELEPVSIKTWEKYVHPDDFERTNQLLEQHFSGMLPYYQSESRMRHKNGHWVWIHDRGRVITKTEDGKPLLMFGTHTDITERKQAEAKILENEKRYKQLIETSNEGILIAQGDKLRFVNSVVRNTTGYSEDELLSTPFIEFIHPDDRQLILYNYQKRLAGEGTSQKYIFRFLGKGNKIVWIEMSGVRIEWEGQPATFNFASDVTERVNAEIQIKLKNEELLRINAEKDKFFSIIAHDLRGPFGGFLGLTESLAEGMQDMSRDELQEITRVLKKSAANLYNLLGNLLEWSRMQRGLTTFNPISFLLMPKIAELLQSVREAADKKEITVKNELPGDTIVFADENMLSSIIRNLLANAVKFTPKGGEIRLSILKTIPGYIQFSVSDTGIGMEPKILENLFNLDVNTSRRGTEGELSTGLGLMICRDFIAKHGGTLEVQSEKSKGSIFSFTLPLK